METRNIEANHLEVRKLETGGIEIILNGEPLTMTTSLEIDMPPGGIFVAKIGFAVSSIKVEADFDNEIVRDLTPEDIYEYLLDSQEKTN